MEKKELSTLQKTVTVIISAVVVFLLLTMFLGEAAKKADPSLEEKQDSQPTQEVQPEHPQIEEQAKPTQWEKVISVSTAVNKQTETIALYGGEQKLIYETTGGDLTYCSVYLMESWETLDVDGGFSVVSIDGVQKGETILRNPVGAYYLDIKAVNGECKVVLQEMR